MAGNFRRPPSASSVRAVHQPDLALYGEGALAVNRYNKTSRVVSFGEGDVWYTPYARSPSPRTKSGLSVYSSILKGSKTPVKTLTSDDQNDYEEVYYTPVNSPDSSGSEVDVPDWMVQPRPQSRKSVTSPLRPVSGHKGLQKSRPTSGHSKQSRTETLSALLDDNDPDHEPITEVLSRLGDYTHTYKPSISLANTDCECKSQDERVSSQLAKVYDSDHGDSSSDSEDEGVRICMMLKTFQQYEDKGHSAVRQKAMLTLLGGFSGEETLTQENAKQLFSYLEDSLVHVQEACLMLLKLCAKKTENVNILLDVGILEFLYKCLQYVELTPLIRPALLLLEVIFSHSQLKEVWLETAYTKFMPEILKLLRGQASLEVKYAACCVFRALAQYDEFVVHVIDVILPTVVMMRNSSAKFKEVYVEILTAVLANTDHVPPDLVDNSAIPITASIIREGPCGPQCASLQLLLSLTASDTGVAMVIETTNLVGMVLCCMKESHCRKVRLNATEVMKNLTTARKLGLCKDLMLQLSSYLVPDFDKETLTSLSLMADPQRVPMATKPRFDEERRMWQGLEKFVDMTKEIIYREAKVKVDELDTVTKIHMKPGIDVCPTQLAVLSHSLHILQNMCLWPLDKSRLGFSANKIDLTTFTDDEKQMARLSKVNRGLTQAIWDKIGVVITDLLSSYASKFKDGCKLKSDQGRQLLELDDIFEPQETKLILSMLELLLCTAVCTCTAFPEILPTKGNKSPKKQSNSEKLKSSSSPHIHCYPDKQDVYNKLKSQSEVGNKFNMEGEKYWMTENPQILSIHGNSSNNAMAADKSKVELKHKEACTDRRLLRKCLYEAGVFSCVCPFLMCSDLGVQVLVLQILRCLIQPLEEKIAPQPPKMTSFMASGSSSSKPRQRPKSAMCAKEAQRKLNIALYKMSPDLAGLIKEALGSSVAEENTEIPSHALKIPGQSNGLETIQERLQEYTESMAGDTGSNKQSPEKKARKPVIDRCRPIAQQCRESLLEEAGDRIVKEIFNKSKLLKKQCVLLLHDLVQYGEVSTHMKLSEYGCMPRLVDYLRVNEEDEILEIIGLIIVRLLVKSDIRLKQLFYRHGGPALLIAMAQYTKGLLKQEVSTTLKTVTKVDTSHVRKRPMTAPVTRSQKPPDIWEHIQARWKQEDEVKNVLRQWIQ